MSFPEKIFDFLPSFVSENPKKIIVVIIAFTLFLGVFAKDIQINSNRESFNPDSEQAELMTEVEDDFGTSDEIVQIAFTADQGDVFTKEVLLDTLETKIALKESKDVNRTLVNSNNNPSGVNTLADMITLTDQAFKLQDQVLQMDNKSKGIEDSAEKQNKMFMIVNDTFKKGSSLIEQARTTQYSKSVKENTTIILNAATQITMNPYSWKSLNPYRTQLQVLVSILQDSQLTLNTKINETEAFINSLDIDSDPQLIVFKDLFEGMNGILKEQTLIEVNDESIQMTVGFLQINEYMRNDPSEPKSSSSLPSLRLTLEKKKEKLSNMSDHEIKNNAYDTLTYDKQKMQEEIDNSNKESQSNIDSAISYSKNSGIYLKDINRTLDTITDTRNVSHDFLGFKAYISSNKISTEKSIKKYGEIKKNIQSGQNLPTMIDGFRTSLSLSISSDLGNPEDPSKVKAKSTIAMVQMNSSYSSETRKEVQYDIKDISEENCEYSEPKIFAQQIMNDQINESTRNSMTTLLPIAFIFVVIVLLIIFRSFTETFISLLSLVFALVWTFGIGVLLGYEFNPMIIAVPILITGLVIDYGIHMVLRYREEKEKDSDPKNSTKIAITTVGGALILTTLTTAIGFLSNTFSNISAMIHFGILAAVGICSSFIIMVTFLPSVIQLVDDWREEREKKKNKKMSKRLKDKGSGFIGSILSLSTDASDKHPFIVILIVSIITFSSFYGVVNIDTTFSMQEFLPEEMSQSENIEYIEANFNVSTSYVYLMIEGDITDPTYLKSIEQVYENNKDNKWTKDNDKNSPLSVIQEYGTAGANQDIYNRTIVQAFSNSDTDGDDIPDRNITHLYDLLFEYEKSRNSIKKVLYINSNDEYTKALIEFKENDDLVNEDNKNAKKMKDQLKDDASPLEEEGYSVSVISNSIMNYYTTTELRNTQQKSMIATIVIIAILLTMVFYFLNSSKVLGVITTIPVTLVTLWIIGTMYISGVSLNVMTVNITALTVGIGIDYSVHITHRFLEEKKEQENLYDAMHDTVQNTGAALFGSAATTMGAFAILSMSQIMPLAKFGFITSIAIGYSFLVAVFVLPSGLMLWAKYKEKTN
ncbi:MAG: efflux RND transporter permease subunit [Thermoplasmatota archaeon]